MTRTGHQSARRPSVGVRLLFLILSMGFWILLVGGTRRDEMVVGACVLLFSAAFASLIWRMETIDVDFPLKDVFLGWRTPWYILIGIYNILCILVRDLLGRRAQSLYLVSGFKTAKSDPRLVARRVLATFYTTLTPDSIVIGIDFQQSRMLVHQLERSGIPRMTQLLGGAGE